MKLMHIYFSTSLGTLYYAPKTRFQSVLQARKCFLGEKLNWNQKVIEEIFDHVFIPHNFFVAVERQFVDTNPDQNNVAHKTLCSILMVLFVMQMRLSSKPGQLAYLHKSQFLILQLFNQCNKMAYCEMCRKKKNFMAYPLYYNYFINLNNFAFHRRKILLALMCHTELIGNLPPLRPLL